MTAIKMFVVCVSVVFVVLLSGCSSLTTKQTIFRDMAIGAAAGAILGQAQSKNKNAFSVMYAGIGAAVTGAYSVQKNVSDDELQDQNRVLKSKLDEIQKRVQPQLIQSGANLYSSPLPKDLSGLVEPGEWKRYKLDQWVQDPYQQNIWYRQVEMFEITPPVSK